MKLKYFPAEELTPEYVTRLKSVCRQVFPDGVQLFPVSNALKAQMILANSDTEEELLSVFQHYVNLVPWPGHDHETLYFDIETDAEELRWNMPTEQFFRLGQYSWGISGEVHTTTSLEEMRALIRKAYGLVGHNIHSFDLSVLLGDEALLLPRVFDTMVHAALVNPAPYSFTVRKGHTYYDGMKPEKALIWLSLDNQCFALGLSGKVGDLKELAKKYGGFGAIPLDDPEYLDYAIGDITALQELTTALLEKRPLEAYDWREQINAAIDAQSTRNGFTVDIAKAQARVDQLQAEKDLLLARLQADYDFPTEGVQPWRSAAGKEAIFRILADNGITLKTRPDWTLTATGNLSLGGEVLLELTDGTAAEDLGAALATLMGQRSLAALALASVQNDGKAHPQITALQRSGRKSTTKPGLTVWSARGDKAVEKSYFIASPGRKLIEFDFSNADSRVVAAYSGDKEFAKRLEPGADGHDLTGELFFGYATYHADRDNLRPLAKVANHALAYRIGKKKLAAKMGVSEAEAYGYILAYQEGYPGVAKWQDEVTRIGERGYITNRWGRRMVVDPDRSFTQSAALLGQSGTREILVDGLIRMLERDPKYIRYLVAQIHDAIVMDVPEDEVDEVTAVVLECCETTWNGIAFPMEHGEPADDWQSAGH